MLIRTANILSIAVLAAAFAGAQDVAGDPRPVSFEAKYIDIADSEREPARRVMLLEAFLQRFPNHAMAGDVRSRLQRAYEGEPVQVASLGAPIVPQRMHARMESSLFNAALQEKDPNRKLELLAQFSREYPNSIHSNSVTYLNFLALRDIGDQKAALATAELLLGKDQSRDDVLLYVAAKYLGEQRELEKAVAYCNMILAMAGTTAKPALADPEEWAKRNQSLVFQANWIAGSAHLQLREWGLAAKALRAALQMAPSGDDSAASILNSLAWTSYKTRNIPEALRLYKRLADQPGPFRSAAQLSIASIKNEYALQ